MKTSLTSLRIVHKLILISGSFLLPIAVLLYFMVSGINYDIQFAELELAGNAYQRPLEKLLEHVSRHQYESATAGAGDTGASARLAQESEAAQQALSDLTSAQSQFGELLQFTDEGLGKRQRSNARPDYLATQWEQLVSRTDSMSAEESDRAHRQLLDLIRTMISHSGDTSNLILDPDLDSYYLMDITLLALPQSLDRLGEFARTAHRYWNLDLL